MVLWHTAPLPDEQESLSDGQRFAEAHGRRIKQRQQRALDHVDDGSVRTVGLEIPGTAVEMLDDYAFICLCIGLDVHHFHCSRIDAFFDDAERLITPSGLHSLVATGRQDYCKFKSESILSRQTIEHGLVRDEVQFGTRGSEGAGKYLRFYDKALESKGEINVCRWEVEFSDQYARELFRRLVATYGPHWTEEKTARAIGSAIGGAIDFRINLHDGNPHVDRHERYPFWQQIVDRLGCVPMKIKRQGKDVECADRYIHQQVAGTLQMLRLAYGDEKFWPMIVDMCGNETKIKPAHRNALKRYLKEHEAKQRLNDDY
jgi:hypothetical protein